MWWGGVGLGLESIVPRFQKKFCLTNLDYKISGKILVIGDLIGRISEVLKFERGIFCWKRRVGARERSGKFRSRGEKLVAKLGGYGLWFSY
jgi:hypothetical protein